MNRPMKAPHVELPVDFRPAGPADQPLLRRLPRLRTEAGDPDAVVRIALLEDRPVAVVRAARPETDGQPPRPGHTDPGLRSIELAIVDPWMDGRSTGARVLWAFATRLFEDPDVRRLQLDADVGAEDLVGACADVGFRSFGLFQGPLGTTHLFSARRRELRSVAPASLSRVMVL